MAIPSIVELLINEKKAPFATGQYCQESNWEPKLGIPIKSPRLKEQLTDIEKKLYDIIRRLEFDGRALSAKLIRDIYKERGLAGKDTTLIMDMTEYIRKISIMKGDYTGGTVQHYRTTKKHLQNFLKSRNDEDLLIQNFSRTHVEGLDEFFVTVPTAQYNKPMGRNTANKYHTKLKTVLLNAVEKKIISGNPHT